MPKEISLTYLLYFCSMKVLSSRLTSVFKFFLPSFGFVFILGINLIVWLKSDIPTVVSIDSLRVLFGSLLIGSILVWLLLFSRLKRIETDGKDITISNYFKTYKYSVESIASLETQNLGLYKMGRITLHQAGKFGKKNSFILSKKYDAIINQYNLNHL